MSPETENSDQLPDALVERLRARDRGIPMLTPAVDRALAEAARSQFAARRKPSRDRRLRYPAAAAAALALAALLIVRPFGESVVETRLADDIDGSGSVDILDAFALARERQADPAAISQRRVDELADRIVSLGAVGAVL